MGYKSKFKGAEIDALLDKVSEGGGDSMPVYKMPNDMASRFWNNELTIEDATTICKALQSKFIVCIYNGQPEYLYDQEFTYYSAYLDGYGVDQDGAMTNGDIIFCYAYNGAEVQKLTFDFEEGTTNVEWL